MSPCWSPGLCGLSHSPVFLLAYLHTNVGLPTPPATTSLGRHLPPHWPAAALPALLPDPPPLWVRQLTPSCESSPPSCQSPHTPMGLDECFSFNFLVVRLPYSFIFCQFWLFFVFKLSFLWLCEEAQCVYLCLHLGPESILFFKMSW